MSKTIYPELQNASQLLAGLAEAFASGTWEGVHKYAARTDLFERLGANACPCCAMVKTDPLGDLMALLFRARQGVQVGKAHKCQEGGAA